jgi:hypothetical protein
MDMAMGPLAVDFTGRGCNEPHQPQLEIGIDRLAPVDGLGVRSSFSSNTRVNNGHAAVP